MMWSCSKRLAYMVANIRKWEQEENKGTVVKLAMIKRWSWTPTYVKHNPKTVFTSRTPPKRDHHGYTRGWCVLIRIWCQVIYNRTLTNSHLPITAGTAFERLYPAGVSQLSPWQALVINEGIDLLPGRPDQTRNPGLQDISTMVKQDQQSRPNVPTNPDRSCTYLVLRAHWMGKTSGWYRPLLPRGSRTSPSLDQHLEKHWPGGG